MIIQRNLFIIISLIMLILFSNSALSANIEVGSDHNSLTKITNAIALGSRTLIEKLMAPDSSTSVLMKLLWQFFGFMMFAFYLFRWVYNKADIHDIFVFVAFMLVTYAFMLFPVSNLNGQSMFSFIGFTVINEITKYSNVLMWEVLGLAGGNSANVDASLIDFFLGFYSRLDYSQGLDFWNVILYGIGVLIAQFLFSIMISLSMLISLMAYMSLSITFIMGVFFVILSFFSYGMQLTMNWLSMCLGWVFTMIIGKIIMALAGLSFIAYMELPKESLVNSQFWAVNTITINFSRLGDVGGLLLLMTIFIIPLIMSIGWGQSLASTSLQSPGRAVGAALLIKRLMK